MPFLNVEEYKSAMDRKSNCLGFALSVTNYESFSELELDYTKELHTAFEDKCKQFGVEIRRQLLNYEEVISSTGTVIVVWGFFFTKNIFGDLVKNDFHVARRDPNGIWSEIQGYGQKPHCTDWEKLVEDYPEPPLFFEVEKR